METRTEPSPRAIAARQIALAAHDAAFAEAQRLGITDPHSVIDGLAVATGVVVASQSPRLDDGAVLEVGNMVVRTACKLRDQTAAGGTVH